MGERDIVLAESPVTCRARAGADGQMRCAQCRLVWDAGDGEGACLRVRIAEPERLPFVSALAPDIFAGQR